MAPLGSGVVDATAAVWVNARAVVGVPPADTSKLWLRTCACARVDLVVCYPRRTALLRRVFGFDAASKAEETARLTRRRALSRLAVDRRALDRRGARLARRARSVLCARGEGDESDGSKSEAGAHCWTYLPREKRGRRGRRRCARAGSHAPLEEVHVLPEEPDGHSAVATREHALLVPLFALPLAPERRQRVESDDECADRSEHAEQEAKCVPSVRFSLRSLLRHRRHPNS